MWKYALFILLLIFDNFNPLFGENVPWNFCYLKSDCQFVSKYYRLQLIISSLNDIVAFDLVVFWETIYLIVQWFHIITSILNIQSA